MLREFGEKIIDNDDFNWACEVYMAERNSETKSDDYKKAKKILDELEYYPGIDDDED